MKKRKIWQLQKDNTEEAASIAKDLGVSPIVVGIVLNRGITTKEEIQEFLFGSQQPFHEPLLMKDMQRAAERILTAIENKERITVYGDYDVDGISASSLLYLYLKNNGADVNTYIPKRKSEGYGLNNEALLFLAEEGTTLLITVDSGISGVNEVACAPKTMDIIITDHHMPPDVLPDAYAIINPHQRECRYPFKELSGVGVAFKLCQALHQMENLTQPLYRGLTELVALGTVADIVSLRGENRALVKMGLAAMENSTILGLNKLIEHSGCPKTGISAENIGFILAPRLNAVGRLEHAQLAVELMITDDLNKADEIAQELNQENILRQEISRKIFVEAEAMLAQQSKIETAIVLAKEGWHAGVIGIVASRLVDKYNLPTILISIDGELAKGSCRSIPALDLYSALNDCKECLLQFGGHRQAAGLTLRAARIESFRKQFLGVVRGRLEPEDYSPKIKIDCLIDEKEELSIDFLQELALLEPFGCENIPPMFAFKNANIHYPNIFGRENNHLRFYVEYGGNDYHSLMWNGASYLPCIYNNAVVDIAFMPKINIWKDKASVNLQVVDFDQDVQAYDYRGINCPKELLLKKILQTSKKTVIYVNDIRRLDELKDRLDAQILLYGETPTIKVEEVIFFDLPSVNVFTEEFFKEISKVGKTLVLLYKNEELEEFSKCIFDQYPGRNQLVEAYKKVSAVLKKQAVIDKEDFLTLHKEVSDKALKIFLELEFIHEEQGKIGFGNVQKRDLQNSETFIVLQDKRNILLENCQRNISITQEKIVDLWKNLLNK